MFHDVPSLWQYVIISIAALLLTLLGLYLYNRVEKRRKHAIELMKLMNQWGLNWFSDLFEDYAVGDYYGIAVKVKEVLQTVRSDQAMVARLEEVAKKVAAFYAAHDPTKAQELMAILQRSAAKPTSNG